MKPEQQAKIDRNVPAWSDARPVSPFWTKEGMYTADPPQRRIVRFTRTTEVIEIQETREPPEPSCWEAFKCCWK